MEPKILPEPPAPPAELNAPSPSPGDPSTTPATGPTPEEIRSSAEDYAGFSTVGVDMLLTRRGFTPMTASELEKWTAQWEKVVRKYPMLASPSKYPEAGLLVGFAGMWMVRVKMEAEAVAQAAAEERARAEAGKVNG